MRRSLVIEFRSQFVSQRSLDRMVASGRVPEQEGVFLRDPTLKEFLREPLTVLCANRMLLGFLREHDVGDCRRIIEDYVVHGKDGGLTRVMMRAACNLPPEAVAPDAGAGSSNAVAEAGPAVGAGVDLVAVDPGEVPPPPSSQNPISAAQKEISARKTEARVSAGRNR